MLYWYRQLLPISALMLAIVVGPQMVLAQDVPAVEREALVALYEATDGDNWDDNENWLSETLVGEWFGVTVEDGNVVELNLTRNNLAGELTPELTELTALTVLRLHGNDLTGTIPSWIGELDQLTWLALWENELTGPIPPELGELTNLEISLGLGRNNLTGEIPPELGQLSNLQLLGMEENNLEGDIPAELGDLTELTGIWLHFNSLEGEVPSSMGNLVNLDDLRVSNNNLSGPLPGELTNIPEGRLEQFWFDETDLCEPPDDVFQEWLASIDDLRSTNEICDPAVPIMVVDPTSFDFGLVEVGESAREIFSVINAGDAALTGAVEDAEAPFAVVEGGGAFTLEPEESLEVTVEYAPEEESELDTGVVLVSSGEVDDETVVLEGSAEAVRQLAVEPGALDFGAVLVGETTTEVFTVTNAGNVGLTGAVEDAEAPFAVVEGGGAFTLEPEESLEVTVEYAPEEESELDTGVVLVSSGEVDDETVALEGVAEAIPPLRIALEQREARGGEPLEVQVTIQEGETDVETAELHYRPVGALVYETVGLEPASPSVYEGAVPAEVVTERGVEYWVRLESVSGSVATVPEADPADVPRFASVHVPLMEAVRELTPETYAMVSVPLELDDEDAVETLARTFGAPDPSQWRLLRWDATAEAYIDYTDPESSSGAAEFVPGKAYWLIRRDGGGVEIVNGRAVGREPITLELEPGWTQLANPRPYPVAWAEVAGIEAISNPVAAPGKDGSALDFDIAVLEPWTGYWVYNFEPTVAELSVPAREADATPKLQAAGDVTSPNTSAPVEGRPPVFFDVSVAYGMQLTATLEQGDDEMLRDAPVAVGIAEEETDLLSRRRMVPKPPPIGEYVRLDVMEDETPLAGSVQVPQEGGHSWDLRLSASNSSTQRPAPVDIEMEVFGEPPLGVEWRLVDRETGRMLAQGENMAHQSVRLYLTSGQPERMLRLFVGTTAYAERGQGAIQPRATKLHRVYPNPASGPLTVEYQLKEAQNVQIDVYDMMGRRVIQLANGHQTMGAHSVEWNTRTSSRPVSNGAYVVRLKAEDTTDTRHFVVVR